MPSHKPVYSLQALCLSSISKHCKMMAIPFPEIPNCILDNIVNHATYSMHLSPDHFDMVIMQYTNRLTMFINQYTNRLDFTDKPDCVVQRGVELICQQIRPNLKHLNLTHLNLTKTSLTSNDLKKLALAIPNIQTLQLRWTKVSDDVLEIIGQNCPNLSVLDVSGSSISNIGLYSLFSNRYSTGKCNLLRKLDIVNTSVTLEGAATAICNLPHLRYFGFDSVLHVLELIQHRNRQATVQFKIENIFRYHPDVTVSNLAMDAASTLCPNVTTANLLCLKNHDHWVAKLVDFPRLTDLTLATKLENNPPAFNGSISRVLKTIGNNLTKLSLHGIEDVNLLEIGLYCGQLTKLEITLSDRFVSTLPVVECFVKLRELVILGDKDKDVPPNELECLLLNCKDLENVQFFHCQSLTDTMLARVFVYNKFTKLRRFLVWKCCNVTMSSLMSLVKMCESLNELRYGKCPEISVNDHRKLQDLVRNQNLDLLIPVDMVQ